MCKRDGLSDVQLLVELTDVTVVQQEGGKIQARSFEFGILERQSDREERRGGYGAVEVDRTGQLNALAQRVDAIDDLILNGIDVDIGRDILERRHVKGVEVQVHVVRELLVQRRVTGAHKQRIGNIQHILQLRDAGLIGSTTIIETQTLCTAGRPIETRLREEISEGLFGHRIFCQDRLIAVAGQRSPLYTQAQLVIVLLLLHAEVGSETTGLKSVLEAVGQEQIHNIIFLR